MHIIWNSTKNNILGSKGAWPGSRDLLLISGILPVGLTFERLKLHNSAISSTIQRTMNYLAYRGSQAHNHLLFQFYPILSPERVKLGTSNFSHRLFAKSSTRKKDNGRQYAVIKTSKTANIIRGDIT